LKRCKSMKRWIGLTRWQRMILLKRLNRLKILKRLLIQIETANVAAYAILKNDLRAKILYYLNSLKHFYKFTLILFQDTKTYFQMSTELDNDATLEEMYLHFKDNADTSATRGRDEWVYNKWGIRPAVVQRMRKDTKLYNEMTDLVQSREVKHGFGFSCIAGKIVIN
jgi:hypothetical protein